MHVHPVDGLEIQWLDPALKLQEAMRLWNVMPRERPSRELRLPRIEAAMNRFPIPEQYVAFVQRRSAAFKTLLFDDSFDQILVPRVIERDVEIAAVPGHVEQMRFRINEETPGAGFDILDGEPCRRHRADML